MTSANRQPRNTPEGGTSPTGETKISGLGRRARNPTPATRSSRLPRRTHPSQRTLLDISTRLQPRDYVLAQLLGEHQTLTTDQIAAVLFTSTRTCRNRLNVLRDMGFIDRFTARHGAGHGTGHSARTPLHWVAGRLSARYAALAAGEPAPTAKALRERQDAIVSGRHLRHRDGLNQFFIDLLTRARAHPHTRLARWWSGPRTTATIGRHIRPDGHGVWREHHDADHDAVRDVGFYLEHDTGTETHNTLIAKLKPYQELRRLGGPAYPLLFWLPATARETKLHHRLADTDLTDLTVATAARDHAAHNIAGPIWRVAGNGHRRLRLAELPADTDPAGPYHPGPATDEQDPLALLRLTTGD